MAFNLGSFGGGVISGAGAGSAFGPVGAGIGAALGGFSSLFGGGGGSGGPQFLPSELMKRYMDIGLAEVKPPKWQKKLSRQDFRTLVKAGDRGGAEDVLRGLAELYPTEKVFSKRLRKSLKKDVDFYTGKGFGLADQIYANAGLPLGEEEFRTLSKRAKQSGIRGSAEFGDFLKQNLVAQGKIMTPQQEQLSYIFGSPRRITEGEYAGRYTNDYMWNR
jgi:hypothetical protein